jgi:gliding motility-associated-like protein
MPQSEDFLNEDCDGDGLTNGEEIGNNPNQPNDSNNNGIPDFLEPNNGNPSSQDGIEVFQLLTPNGDGDNDVFVIRNIENFPNNSVQIFNRWGVKVYETTGYGQGNNFFRGVSEGRVTVNRSDELPVGTYYYILRYVNANGQTISRSGYLYINR